MGPTVLGKDDLLPVRPGSDPRQIVLDDDPGIKSGSGNTIVGIGQHGEIDNVDSIQDRLSATDDLVAGDHFRGGDKNPKRGEVFLGKLDLGDEVIRGQVVAVQGLGTELNGPGDELGLGIGMKNREQGIPAGPPGDGTSGSSLRVGKISVRRAPEIEHWQGLKDKEKLTQIKA